MLFKSDMRIVVDCLAEGKDYVPSKQRIVHLEALLLMLKELTKDERFEEIILSLQEDEKEAGGMNMCELLDKYENRGLERGLEQGLERGMAQGLARGRECVNDLIRHLIEDGRIDEIERAVFDMEYQDKLLAEYGI